MFSPACSECGKDTQVPFRPTAGKPVYCRECFQKRGSGGSGRPAGPASPGLTATEAIPPAARAGAATITTDERHDSQASIPPAMPAGQYGASEAGPWSEDAPPE